MYRPTDYVNIAGRSSTIYSKMQWTKMGVFELYTRKYLANVKQYGNGYYQYGIAHR